MILWANTLKKLELPYDASFDTDRYTLIDCKENFWVYREKYSNTIANFVFFKILKRYCQEKLVRQSYNYQNLKKNKNFYSFWSQTWIIQWANIMNKSPKKYRIWTKLLRNFAIQDYWNQWQITHFLHMDINHHSVF